MAVGSILPRATQPRRKIYVASRPRVQRSRKATLKRILAVGLLFALTGLAVLLLYGMWYVRSVAGRLPSLANLADLRVHPITTVVSSDGVILATLETEYRRPVSLSQISPFLMDATIATEDSRFYEHEGVDMRGIARAFISNLRGGNMTGQGGSTITQQLARNVYLSPDKTLERKVQEMLLAHKIEATYSKREILEMYLNQVYYGNHNYGAEAAARAYFGKSARTLTLGEAALLAGLPQRPGAYSPVEHLDAALLRRSEVLSRMVATHKITEAQRVRAEAQRPRILRPNLTPMANWKAPFFVTHVLKQLRDTYGPEFLYSGARIETTLDWKIQQAAERALRTGIGQGWGANTGALVSIDPRNGFVRALVGGADFRKDQFNAVTQGARQPGSAFKPFVYAAAFDMDVCDLWTTVRDEKLVYPMQPKDWVVHNYGGGYRGDVMILDALRRSINTVAVKMGEKTVPLTVASYAQRLGITTPLTPTLPLALGASAVRPLDICSAFSAFANQGDRYAPVFVTRITDAQGQEVYRDDLHARYHPNFLKARTLDEINIGLREVVLHGTGTAAAAIEDAHGKTGTTSSHRDAWFVGYTSDLATAVWVARTQKVRQQIGHQQMVLTRYLPMPGATGGHLCAPIWREFMISAIPLQRKFNQKHGIGPDKISVPTLEALQKTVIEERKRQAARIEGTEPTDTPPPPASDADARPAAFSRISNREGIAEGAGNYSEHNTTTSDGQASDDSVE